MIRVLKHLQGKFLVLAVFAHVHHACCYAHGAGLLQVFAAVAWPSGSMTEYGLVRLPVVLQSSSGMAAVAGVPVRSRICAVFPGRMRANPYWLTWLVNAASRHTISDCVRRLCQQTTAECINLIK
jgi:hypothetical protein